MTRLTMTKIVVADLQLCSDFYRSVGGFDLSEVVAGEGFREIILRRSDHRDVCLILLRSDAGSSPGEAVLVFETDDLEGMAARVVAAGGSVSQPPTDLPQLGLSYAMFADPEGHMVEGLRYHPERSPTR